MQSSVRVILALLASLGAATALRQPVTLDRLAARALAHLDGEQVLAGLERDVRVIRDRWGIPHIYAQSPADLFVAQGYVMAQDRLWQMEMWRRRARGELAEILGPGALPRDRLARLLRYRGAMDGREWTAYHPDARRLLGAYAAGINAYLTVHRDRLPIEFVLTGVRPEPWSAEDLVLRQITFGDAATEIQTARSVAAVGADETNRRLNPDPWDPLVLPSDLDVAAIGARGDAIAAAMDPRDSSPPPAVLPPFAGLVHGATGSGVQVRDPGSNNWVLSSVMSATGKPVLANDPHREVAIPSLRYIVHLNAPGWNVIGATEPPFAGVAIGHNERVAWGLTIVGTDQHDVYVEHLNPADPDQVLWNGRWEAVTTVREEITVKGAEPEVVDLKFTRHGPVFFEDRDRHRAYVLRSALHEPGTAPYLAGLRLAQARNCRDFLDAAMYWYAPSENLICGDVDGNIAWQASALTPSRNGWTGRLPVPGTGQYEWNGFRKDLPRELNPERGFIVTANNNIHPPGYTPPLMFKNADARFDRITRLLQLITPGRKYTLEDHARIQHDAYSLRAAADVPLFRGWSASDPVVDRARELVSAWDATYRRESAAAAIYEAAATSIPRQALTAAEPPEQRKEVLEPALRRAVDTLVRLQGPDPSRWRWGRLHMRALDHQFVPAFSLPAVERPGGAGTVAAEGATYRQILDVADWDRSLVTNVPGQSGQPGGAYYANLLPLWAEDKYLPLLYSEGAVRAGAARTLVLRPAQ